MADDLEVVKKGTLNKMLAMQIRIEKLEAALRDVMEMAEVHEIPFRDRMMYVSDIARKAQERTDD